VLILCEFIEFDLLAQKNRVGQGGVIKLTLLPPIVSFQATKFAAFFGQKKAPEIPRLFNTAFI
jgi:hypothetical protein